MKRREFIAAVGGLAMAWPGAAHGQQRIHRIATMSNAAPDDPLAQREIAGFIQQLRSFGWTEGANLRIDQHYTAGDATRMAATAKTVAASRPDVILARSTPVVKALMQEMRTTRNTPIVFVSVSDPVGEKLVDTIAHPGGNVTGFTNLEASMGSKWLELLKEIAPGVTHIAVLYNPEVATSGGSFYLRTMQTAASSLAVTLRTIPVRTPADIEKALAEIPRESNNGLVMMPDPFVNAHRGAITEFALRRRLPAVYPFRNMATEGGLLSYGVDLIDLSRRAAEYVDRILRGTDPGILPVQAPTRFELVVNLKTAKAIGLKVPETFLLRADEVIE